MITETNNSAAACEAISKGIPAIAFSGVGGIQHCYTNADPVADVYAQVATKLVNAVVDPGAPYLPNGVGLVRSCVCVTFHNANTVLECQPASGECNAMHKRRRLHVHPVAGEHRHHTLESGRQSMRQHYPSYGDNGH
jgi:hypothetical protein